MKQVNTFDLLKAMLEIAPKNDVRYYLNGIHITRGDSAEVIVEATDGHCLLRVTLPAPLEEEVTAKPLTDVILDRASAEKMLKVFTRKNPPLISADDGLVFFGNYEVETIDGRFPDCGRMLKARTSRTLTADEQGVKLSLLSRATKAMSKLINNAKFSSHQDAAGFKMEADTEAGRVTLLVMPCRL